MSLISISSLSLSLSVCTFSVQLHRARAMRYVGGDSLFRYRAQHYKESSGALLVGADSAQAQVLHGLPEKV